MWYHKFVISKRTREPYTLCCYFVNSNLSDLLPCSSQKGQQKQIATSRQRASCCLAFYKKTKRENRSEKESERAIFLGRSFKKSDKERFALLLFAKRAPKSKSRFRSFRTIAKERISLSLSCNKRERAKRSFALFKKSEKERFALLLF